MYVCICRAVTENEIHDAVDRGASTINELHEDLGVATGCGTCACTVESVIEERIETRNGLPTPALAHL